VEPLQSRLAVFFVECLADLGVELNCLQQEPSELLFTNNDAFAFVETRLRDELGRVEFGDGERTFVLLFFTFEAVAFLVAAPDAPPFADEFSGVERIGAVDLEDRRLEDLVG